MMLDTLRHQIELYLPDIEPGSTFLDAGCHNGAMYDILINSMKLDIRYLGLERDENLYDQAVAIYGKENFLLIDFMDYYIKHDYVWCSQMTMDDNPSAFRHLCGLARKGIVYTHINPQQGHENVIDAVSKRDEGGFKVYQV